MKLCSSETPECPKFYGKMHIQQPLHATEFKQLKCLERFLSDQKCFIWLHQLQGHLLICLLTYLLTYLLLYIYI